MKTIVAVLETMWGDRNGRAPRYFKINPHNLSGKRLYRFVGQQNASRLYVTNACPQLVNAAHKHGKPDPVWLLDNLKRLKPAVILLCGKVAQRTFEQANGLRAIASWDDGVGKVLVMYMMHPAARTWTKAKLLETERQVQRSLK